MSVRCERRAAHVTYVYGQVFVPDSTEKERKHTYGHAFVRGYAELAGDQLLHLDRGERKRFPLALWA